MEEKKIRKNCYVFRSDRVDRVEKLKPKIPKEWKWDLYREKTSDCEWDRCFIAGPLFMCFAVKFCFRLYGLQAFFFLSWVFYGTVLNLCSFISHSGWVCWHCVSTMCVRAFIHSSGVQKVRLSFKHMPSTSGRLQSSRGNKEEVRQKASPWLQATVEAAT